MPIQAVDFLGQVAREILGINLAVNGAYWARKVRSLFPRSLLSHCRDIGSNPIRRVSNREGLNYQSGSASICGHSRRMQPVLFEKGI